MTIKTKLDLNDECFFLMGNKINKAVIKEIETRNKREQSTVIYYINENPVGEQYTTRFLESELFETKQDLLETL